MMNKRGIVYLVTEMLYVAINIAYLLFFKSRLIFNNTNDIWGMLFCITVIISIVITLPPFLNRFVILGFSYFVFMYISGQQNYFNSHNDYFLYSFKNINEYGSKTSIIPIIIISLIFLLVYIFYQRKLVKEFNTIKYRLIGPALLVFCVFYISTNTKQIKKTSFDNRYSLNETPYYNYIHFENYGDFVDNYGIFSFLKRDLELNDEDKNVESKKEEIAKQLNTLPKNETNRFTGIFKDKDVIFIHTKNLNYKSMNSELTPTLLNIYRNSLRANYFSTPPLGADGYDSEFMANTSLIPDSNKEYVCYEYDDNNYPYTLAKLFASDNYATSFYINDYSVYYNREKMVGNFGYGDFFYNARLLGQEASDVDVSRSIASIYQYATEYKLMGYWVIDYDNTALTDERIQQIQTILPELEEEYYGDYANAMALDDIISAFINVLRESNRLDDTVIVLFGDGGTKSYSRSGLLFYSSIYKENVDAYGTLLDLAPTVANLWGIETNNFIFFGGDIFSDSYVANCFEFDESISQYWSNKYGHYSYISHFATTNDEADISQSKLLKMNEEFAKRIRLSFDVIKYDYFK